MTLKWRDGRPLLIGEGAHLVKPAGIPRVQPSKD